MGQIKTFNDLRVWQKAHELVLEIYKITKNFPSEEKYALIQQLRRAVVSIASNIVEGFNRRTLKDSLYFYNISRSSLEEVKYQLLIAKDLNYQSLEDYQNLIKLCESVGRLLNYWIISQKEKPKTK